MPLLVMPTLLKSDAQPVVMFEVMLVIVSLLQTSAAHNPCNHVFMGLMTEALADNVTMATKPGTFRHELASELPAMARRVL